MFVIVLLTTLLITAVLWFYSPSDFVDEFLKKYDIGWYGMIKCGDGNQHYCKYDVRGNITQPTRIASISKALTSLTVLSIIQKGSHSLTLESTISSIFPNLKCVDGRVLGITIDQLLNHTGGWDTREGFDICEGSGKCYHISDPQYDLAKIVKSKYELVDYILQTQKLNHNPGSVYAYSNFGYNVLGRILEIVCGKSYETIVFDEILTESGIARTEAWVSTRSDKPHPQEVIYDDKTDDLEFSIYKDTPYKVPLSYGSSYDLGLMDSHGGWVMSVETLVKVIPLAMKITCDIRDFKGNHIYGMRTYTNNKRRMFIHNGALTNGVFGIFSFSNDGRMFVMVVNHFDGKMMEVEDNVRKEVFQI